MPEEASTLENVPPPNDVPANAAPDEQQPEQAPAAHSANEPPAPPAEAAPPAELPAEPSKKHWYVVKVQSGREETIKESIERRVKIEGLEEYYGQIYIPAERVTEMRKGKRYTREKKTLPG